MTPSDVLSMLASHPFLCGLTDEPLAEIARVSRLRDFAPGDFLCREGEPADSFFLLRIGRVAIEVRTPKRGDVRVQTLGAGEVIGWSWIVAPYHWQFTARVVEPGQVIVVDAATLRTRCQQNHELGFHLLLRLVNVMASRLAATRLLLLDVYE